MKTLNEFLKEYTEQHAPLLPQRQAIQEEWVRSVERLMQQIRDWLAEADPAGVLDIQTRTIIRREEGIGSYEVPGLSIVLGAREVEVLPIARNVVWRLKESEPRAQGMVRITDGGYRYDLYRTVDEQGEHWWMVNHQAQVRPWDRSAFDHALVTLLA